MAKKLRCVDGKGLSSIKNGVTYILDRESPEYYHLIGYSGGFYKRRFKIIANEKPEVSTIDKLSARIDQLETTIRHMQDQLDNHDHKTNIDFATEKE